MEHHFLDDRELRLEHGGAAKYPCKSPKPSVGSSRRELLHIPGAWHSGGVSEMTSILAGQ